MSQITRMLSPRESIQMAWGAKLRDFRQWCSPQAQKSIRDWKTRRLEGAIIVSKSSMVDDVEAMFKSVQENDNAGAADNTTESGTSVSMPVMITAIAVIDTPPERDVVIGQPHWLNVVVPSDPLQRVAQMRTTAVTYRCQIAFFCSDPHAASSIANQFVSYWKAEGKRPIEVLHEVGIAGTSIIKAGWDLRVVENTLTPDKIDIDTKTIYGITVDCLVVGLEPTIVGLGHPDDDITDTGEPDGSIKPGLTPIPGSRDPEDKLNGVVTEADVIDTASDTHVRVTIDPLTDVITQINIEDE